MIVRGRQQMLWPRLPSNKNGIGVPHAGQSTPEEERTGVAKQAECEAPSVGLKIPNGTTVEVLEEQGADVRLRFGGIEGWTKTANVVVPPRHAPSKHVDPQRKLAGPFGVSLPAIRAVIVDECGAAMGVNGYTLLEKHLRPHVETHARWLVCKDAILRDPQVAREARSWKSVDLCVSYPGRAT